MIDLTRLQHVPGFDLNLEILAFLPPAPASAPLWLIARDLGCESQQALLQSLHQSSKMYGVTVHNFDGERVASIRPSRWPATRAAVEQYAAAVWDDRTEGAGNE